MQHSLWMQLSLKCRVFKYGTEGKRRRTCFHLKAEKNLQVAYSLFFGSKTTNIHGYINAAENGSVLFRVLIRKRATQTTKTGK